MKRMETKHHSLNNWRGRRAAKRLWRPGTLFHRFGRFPLPEVALDSGSTDRLTSILEYGLMAPAHCADGSVVSDLPHLKVGLDRLGVTLDETEVAYDSLVFLHSYRPDTSWIYMMLGDGANDTSCLVVLDDSTPTTPPDAMGEDWLMLSQDEVYSHNPIPADKLRAAYMPLRYLQETTVQAALEPHDIPVFTY
jgi:hypothetical protein